MAVSTSSALDTAALRADFPFLEEQVDGKPLAYLDSASSTQKPRQVLDRMRSFYEHEYANVHRGVYRLAERATEGYEGARGTVAAFVNAPSEREVIFTRSATEAINLVAYAWGLAEPRPRRHRRDHRARAPRELRPLAVHRQQDRCELPPHPDRRRRRAPARRARRAWRGRARSRSSRPGSSRTRSARSTRSSGWRPGRTSRARSWSSTPRRRRRTGRSTCRRSAATSSPSRRTSSAARAASVRSGAGASCSRRWSRSTSAAR